MWCVGLWDCNARRNATDDTVAVGGARAWGVWRTYHCSPATCTRNMNQQEARMPSAPRLRPATSSPQAARQPDEDDEAEGLESEATTRRSTHTPNGRTERVIQNNIHICLNNESTNLKLRTLILDNQLANGGRVCYNAQLCSMKSDY